MENDINHILATKRAWRTSERRGQDRRVKDGSYEDRKNTAMAIKEGRKQQQKITWWRRLLNNFSFLFLFLILCPIVHSQEIPLIVRIAESQIGKGEIGGNNKGSQVEEYTRGLHVAWCAAFVSWVRYQSGVRDHYYFSARSYWIRGSHISGNSLRPGDLIVFSRGLYQGHVGIIEKIQGSILTTIEGNVGRYPAKVKREKYRIGHIKHLLGFVRMK